MQQTQQLTTPPHNNMAKTLAGLQTVLATIGTTLALSVVSPNLNPSTFAQSPVEIGQPAMAQTNNPKQIIQNIKNMSDRYKVPIVATTSHQSNAELISSALYNNWGEKVDYCSLYSGQTKAGIEKTDKQGVYSGGGLLNNGDCYAYIPLDVFMATNPDAYFQRNYPQLRNEIIEKVTSFQFSPSQRRKIVEKIADIIDGEGDQNSGTRKTVIVYSSGVMYDNLRNKIYDTKNALRLPSLRSDSIAHSSDSNHEELLRENGGRPVGLRNDVVLVDPRTLIN